MNNPQLWGLLRGLCIAAGGAVAARGVMSVADWALFVDQAMSAAQKTLDAATAIAGIVAIVVPMVRGWRSRSRAGLVTTTAEVLKPGEKIVVDPLLAAVIPSPQVVPPGA